MNLFGFFALNMINNNLFIYFQIKMNSLNTVYKYIEIRYADPICSLALDEKSLLFGTMMGRSGYFSIPDKKFFLLSETQNEHISGTQLNKENQEMFFVSIGDEEVQVFTKNESGIPKYESKMNYETDGDHNSKCESCYTLLNDIYLLRVFLHIPQDNDAEAVTANCDYIVKNIINNECDSGQIEMSNYAVPFDYDGKRFIWVDFYSNKERAVLLYNFVSKKVTMKEKLNEDFGHISHLKLIPNGKFFLVRKYNICEIRNEKFEIEKTFGHIGKEVLACDFMCNNDKMIIVTLDIDGNVNVYDYKTDKVERLFNLYDLNSISQEEKDRQFFSMGYPYYIKVNSTYIAVTTDYGCYIIKR